MKNILKNNKGFTLVELVMAGGLVGVVALVGISTLKTTNQAVNIEVVGSEISTLKSTIVAQLANPDSCSKTFPPGTPAVRSNISILTPSGGVIARKDLEYGSRKEFKITDISSSSAIGSSMLTIKVDYAMRATLDRGGKKTNSFTIDLFVTKNSANAITSCFVDIAGSTRTAIRLSCIGIGAVYDEFSGIYGTCTHALPEMKSGATVVTTTCPAGQYLKNVTLTSSPNKVNLECVALAVPACPDWSYLNKIDDVTGAASCVALSTLFAAGTVLSASATGYVPLDLNCPADMVLRKINLDGSKGCIPEFLTKVCPPDEYVYDVIITGPGPTDYNVQCKKFTKMSAQCGANQYLRAVNSDGSIPVGGCADLSLPATCVGFAGTNDYVIQGLDSNGNATGCTRSY